MAAKGTLLLIFLMATVPWRAVAQDKSLKKDKPAPQKTNKNNQPLIEEMVEKLDYINEKAEKLFRILPVPFYSYTSEAGNIVGLAKFNLFHPSAHDRSKPSRLSELVTISSKRRINVFISNELLLRENRYMILSSFNYRRQPEYLQGIGNDVLNNKKEQVSIDRVRFTSTPLRRFHNNLYAGLSIDIARYTIRADSAGYLREGIVTGTRGGTDVGLGIAGALDSRDNRYNARRGAYVLTTLVFYPKFLGSTYAFHRFELDARHYFNPWRKHVIAVQATTSYVGGNPPFYNLSLLGGEERMRGYYKGALRDRTLVDAQVEYRMPVWKIFGVAGWVGTGRVGTGYDDLALSGFHLSYGGGLRVRVDTRNNTNMRFDMGFAPHGIRGFYIAFAEAF
ncbi:BamA/TamA family outer membrane protein [Fulvivirgaceae bacterium PWU5]|uniref:BamA/TamA family outer membrane protein n=1 Tax=Dawidia cretensis TaxID=2782350 RepID=A0AAP2DXL3_9BACT|nr:BamA/TamA family outer membrane protein [Dawidia cretensis]MBT1709206.1 BamA/TamA family outer membrane protein [Dawidia cretensis]